MSKRCLIVAGGELHWEFASCYIKTKYASEQPEYVIAVDGGLEAVMQLGLNPDLILGDYDSVAHNVLDKYRNLDTARILQYPSEKDYTDLHLAVEKAVEGDVTEICILGATGRRLDHGLANLGLLKICLDAGIPTEITDAYNRIRMIKDTMELSKEEQYGTYVSLIPFTEQVSGITLTGFKYPLENAMLEQGISRGISNEIQKEVARIQLTDGILLVIESRDSIQ